MSGEAEQRLEKADDLIAKLGKLDAGEVPEAVVHLAYFAMLHAASAALIATGGETPKRHGKLIGAFGRIIKDRDDIDKSMGRTFNRAYDIRCAADYDTAPGDMINAAKNLAAAAPGFVETCRRIVKGA